MKNGTAKVAKESSDIRAILKAIVTKHFLNQRNGSRYFCEKQIQFKLGLELCKKLRNEPVFEQAFPLALPPTKATRQYMDLAVNIGNKRIGIEIKYKTTNKIQGSESYQHHGAQTNGRAQCLFDIYRLEKFVKTGHMTNGYFIFITNDKTYWSDCIGDKQIYNLTDGTEKTGLFNANWDSCPEYCKDFTLFGKYAINWFGASSFRCIIISVPGLIGPKRARKISSKSGKR